MRKILTFFLCLIIIVSFILPISAQEPSQPIYFEAKIIELTQSATDAKVVIHEIKGDGYGKKYTISLYDQQQIAKQNLKIGDAVIVSYQKDPTGREMVYITDHVRRSPLIVLGLVFALFVIAIGRGKGILSLLGMIFSFVIIMKMIIPGILVGNNPVVISLLGALFIIPTSFYISHGLNRKTTIAVVSTFIALALTGILAYTFVLATKLTGFAAEESTFIQFLQGGTIDIRSLLLAGIIIGAMGVLDDITISQTAIVEKLFKANPKFTFNELFAHAMDVGRDHIASLVNTLVLVYAGAALPLFLLFYNSQLSYSQVINQEIIATEIVRTLVSSIGIIAAVPITTFLACLVVKRK